MDLIGIHLREALHGGGCPVCRLLEKYEDNEIGTILYEHVNDPEVRERFKESLGLCTYHAWKTLQKAYSEPLLGPLGVSIIYEHMLSVYIDSLETGKKIGTGNCFVCTLLEEKERTTIEALAERIGELLPEYRASSSILCRRHYDMLLQAIGEESEEAKRLREVQLEKLRALDGRMKSFIDKFDYRSTEPHTDEEVNALPTAIEVLKGREIVVPLKEKRDKKRGFLWR